MKKILIMIFCPLLLSGCTTGNYDAKAQVEKDRWVVIPAADSAYFKKKKITWFYGIDAVQLKNGDYTLPERVIKDMERFDVKKLEFTKDDQVLRLDNELKKLPITDKPIFKEAEIIEIRSD